jgi:hypothetical protein
MASRFFYGSGSDSDSSSDEEEEVYRSGSDSEESSEEESDSGSDSGSDSEDGQEKRTGASKFMHSDSDSDESEEEEKVTVVKSAKDKRLEGVESTIRLIENAQKINDWAVIATGESPCIWEDWKPTTIRGVERMGWTDRIPTQSSTTSTARCSRLPDLPPRSTSRPSPTSRISPTRPPLSRRPPTRR